MRWDILICEKLFNSKKEIVEGEGVELEGKKVKVE